MEKSYPLYVSGGGGAGCFFVILMGCHLVWIAEVGSAIFLGGALSLECNLFFTSASARSQRFQICQCAKRYSAIAEASARRYPPPPRQPGQNWSRWGMGHGWPYLRSLGPSHREKSGNRPGRGAQPTGKICDSFLFVFFSFVSQCMTNNDLHVITKSLFHHKKPIFVHIFCFLCLLYR